MLNELEKRIEEIEDSISLDLEMHGEIIQGHVQEIDCELSLSLYERRLRLLELYNFKEDVFGIHDERVNDVKQNLKQHKKYTLQYMFRNFGIGTIQDY